MQHSLRTSKSLFPFLYTCIIHLDPSKELIQENKEFMKLIGFFGGGQAPRLNMRIVHLLFVLDFLTSYILKRYVLMHGLLTSQTDSPEEGMQQMQKLGKEFEKAFLCHRPVSTPKLEDKEDFSKKDSKDNHSSKANSENVPGKPRIKLYKPKGNISPKKENRNDESQENLIGFNELRNSDLLQGSSLLKSIELGKLDYNTSEDVTALMNSSFLATTLEALKFKKNKLYKLEQSPESVKEQMDDLTVKKDSARDLKQQIVGNLYRYYDSKASYPKEYLGEGSSRSGSNDKREPNSPDSFNEVVEDINMSHNSLQEKSNEIVPETNEHESILRNSEQNQDLKNQENHMIESGTDSKKEAISFNLTKNLEMENQPSGLSLNKGNHSREEDSSLM